MESKSRIKISDEVEYLTRSKHFTHFPCHMGGYIWFADGRCACGYKVSKKIYFTMRMLVFNRKCRGGKY